MTDQPTTSAGGFRFVSALSGEMDARVAMDAIAAEFTAASPAPIRDADLAIIFATYHHRNVMGYLAKRVREAFPQAALVGITAEGVIGVRQEIEDKPGISVLAASLPGAWVKPFAVESGQWVKTLSDPQRFAGALGIDDGRTPKAVILLPDPFSTPVLKFMEMMQTAWPGVPLVGGMGSGGRQAGANRLVWGERVTDGGAVGLCFGGGIDIDTVVSQGCRALGRPLVITRSEKQKGNHVLELGGQKSLAALQDVIQGLDDVERGLVESHGLMIGRVINEYKDRFGRGDFLMRQLVGVDPERGALVVGDPQMRVGQTVQFHARDRKTAAEDFAMLLEMQKLDAPPGGAVLFSCNGRGSRLYEEPHKDASIVAEALGDVPLAGFFAAGELGPVGGENFVHGHTACLVVFRPADDSATDAATDGATDDDTDSDAD